MTTSELKPCPFCGGTEIHIGPMDQPSAWECWVVGCNNYDCPLDVDSVKVEFGTPENAAAAWNTRATDANLAALQAEIERLRAGVAEWKRVAAAQAELHDEAEARAERLAEALRKLEEREQRDEALLRQALEALELRCGTHADERKKLIPALRERLGEGAEP